ncbi:MAG: hypothetical protein CMF69_10285 [Magnetovibrio sp.]|nr:hypothetical protein [Magnetovibrio sp.]
MAVLSSNQTEMKAHNRASLADRININSIKIKGFFYTQANLPTLIIIRHTLLLLFILIILLIEI